MQFGLVLTVVGMGTVFAFLCFVSLMIRLSSWAVRRFEGQSDESDKVALSIAIALNKRG